MTYIVQKLFGKKYYKNNNKTMSIKNILVTNDDGTTQTFVPEVTTVTPRTVTVPLGVDVILTAEVPTP